jgi:hypothetical protein
MTFDDSIGMCLYFTIQGPWATVLLCWRQESALLANLEKDLDIQNAETCIMVS